MVCAASLCAIVCAFGARAEQKSPAGWFTEANARMSLRSPGTAGFHLHVDFHARGGEELLTKGEQSSIATGDGTYDEIWLEPHKWRREVVFGKYHAIEIDSGGSRKLQSSLDYEPSRVIMLLDALLSPVPKALASREFGKGSGWATDHLESGGLKVVRLSKSSGSQRAEYSDSFYFDQESGDLMMSNLQGLITIWSQSIAFGDKVCPQSIVIRNGEQELVNAKVMIDAARDGDAAEFSLDAAPATPGRTLRPLHASEARMPELSGAFSYIVGELGPAPVFSMTGILDRYGRFEELEILVAPNAASAAKIMRHFRDLHTKPPTIDGDVCQVRMWWRTM
jgi:hypothetical protein